MLVLVKMCLGHRQVLFSWNYLSRAAGTADQLLLRREYKTRAEAENLSPGQDSADMTD